MKTSNFLGLGVLGLLCYARLTGFDTAAFLVSTKNDANKHLIEQLAPLEKPTKSWLGLLKKDKNEEELLWQE